MTRNNNTNNDSHDAFTRKRVSKYILVGLRNKKFTSGIMPTS